ncbi:hypothetical protein F751_1848 [Auxenochlorella protothecoides]|uniref:Uncharacterized protein n=1 Tax=Auxenochlorella protothecoides TaxID=3075 RepID=A0A087SGW5_AUXPR|nr:hypothetical protein F751_1848 [Auxenochlorella protothecoides]KFM24969.1 hypothetical protein F751_1848 [Auxenochlorella protothecoides]
MVEQRWSLVPRAVVVSQSPRAPSSIKRNPSGGCTPLTTKMGCTPSLGRCGKAGVRDEGRVSGSATWY